MSRSRKIVHEISGAIVFLLFECNLTKRPFIWKEMDLNLHDDQPCSSGFGNGQEKQILDFANESTRLLGLDNRSTNKGQVRPITFIMIE